MKLYALVLTDIVHQKIDRLFTYRVPDEFISKVEVGMRVIVPFGRLKTEGYILHLSDTAELEDSRIKSIIKLIDEYPVLSQMQIELAYWMKEKYHSMLAQVIRLMLPAQMRKNRVHEKLVTEISLCGDLNEIPKSIRVGTKKHKVLLYLKLYGKCEKKILTDELGAIDEPLRKLEQEGFIKLTKKGVFRSPYKDMEKTEGTWFSLKNEQKSALKAICSAMDVGNENILLHGITGSGKTEVYMQAIRYALEKNATAIMLIPEISLTPQTVSRFRERFGDSVAVLHSALSAGERYDEWQRIRQGQARVVVGARSAIFAPCKNIKLIIIDEAHESSYCASNHPAYSAVEVAKKLAKLHNGILVLGSATPSIEQYYSAEKGEYKIVKMLNRINGRPLPTIEVVDMAAELASGNKSIFSKKLYMALEETINNGKQAILFLNRRGHSTVVTCRSCGESIKCANCDISMTYHLSQINSLGGANRLRCHYCGSEQPYPSVCPKCGSKYIKFMGAGTEKVEQECEKFFPGVSIARMDNDTTRGKDSHLHILSRFAKGDARILIGTQMIAKGLDFPQVALVGIISADTMLQLPDYTSREKTYGLITQVAGRAGRAETGGRVILQTYTPKHYAIADAVSYSYEDFYKRDLISREHGLYPPFGRILRAVFMCENTDKAKNACYTYFQSLRQVIMPLDGYKATVVYFNMMTAPIGRINGMYRYQILLKMRVNEYTSVYEKEFFDYYNKFSNDEVYVDVEVDPLSLY